MITWPILFTITSVWWYAACLDVVQMVVTGRVES